MRTSAGGPRLAALLLSWLAGVATPLHERPLLPLSTYVVAAGVAAIVLGVAIRRRRGGRGITLLAAAGAALAGVCVGAVAGRCAPASRRNRAAVEGAR